ncbi:phospholipase A and acyltransferase 5-like [Phascolarctos cinereus]
MVDSQRKGRLTDGVSCVQSGQEASATDPKYVSGKERQPLADQVLLSRRARLQPALVITSSKPSVQVKPAPKPGNIIEYDSSVFSHWAIYVGGNCMVHLVPTGEKTSGSAMATHAIVEKKSVDTDVRGKYKINNTYDKIYKPLPPEVMVERALKMVGKTVPYCAVLQNCQDFVINLRYGEHPEARHWQSGQVCGERITGILGAVLSCWLHGAYMMTLRDRRQNHHGHLHYGSMAGLQL